MMVLPALGSREHLEPLTASLEGGWAPSNQRITCWGGGPQVPAPKEQRPKVWECLGREGRGALPGQGRQHPKGPWGDAAILTVGSWLRWVRVPS